MRSWGFVGLVLVLAAGLVAGLAAYTFIYGKGYSYLLDDPRACVNCHVMRDNFDTWTVATHRTVTCNQCHVPHAFPARYLSEARNGWFHSYAFTFKDVQTIRIKSGNQNVLQENCEGCHERMIINIQPHGAERAKYCFDCHKGAGHGL
jgi:cytochrome c nitrite reductase small subunit